MQNPTSQPLEAKGKTTLNRASVSGSRRIVYGLLYALSIAGLLVGVALLGTAVQVVVTSVSEVSNHYWGDNWLLVAIGLVIGGVVVIVGSSVAAGKFKREGAEDITEILSR